MAPGWADGNPVRRFVQGSPTTDRLIGGIG
jgi:hypothetical protein